MGRYFTATYEFHLSAIMADGLAAPGRIAISNEISLLAEAPGRAQCPS